MKVNRSALISLAVIVIYLILSVSLRTVPVSRIWDSYSVVYVDKSMPEEEVLAVFEKYSVEHIISLGRQRIPFVSDFTPVMPQKASSYLSDRLSYFFDFSDTYCLYYIPRGNDSGAGKALDEIMRTTNTSCGIDGKQQYPWLVPLVVLVVFCVFTCFSFNRIAFAVSALPSVVLSFSQVFYPVAAACILFMLSCYLASSLWGRRKAIAVLKKNLYTIIPFAVSVFSMMVLSLQCALLVLLCCASSVCALIIYDAWQKYCDSKITFKVVKIFGAPQLPVMYTTTAKHTLMCLVPLFLILVVFLVSSRISSNSNSGISIPVPVAAGSVDESSEKVLPSLKDYYKWSWITKSYPYRSLNEPQPQELNDGDSVVVSRYEVVDDRIVETQATVMTYGEEFRDKIDKEIDGLEYDAVEKLMKKQGDEVSVVYRDGSESRGQTDALGLVLILVCIFVPVLLILIYVVKSGRK